MDGNQIPHNSTKEPESHLLMPSYQTSGFVAVVCSNRTVADGGAAERQAVDRRLGSGSWSRVFLCPVVKFPLVDISGPENWLLLETCGLVVTPQKTSGVSLVFLGCFCSIFEGFFWSSNLKNLFECHNSTIPHRAIKRVVWNSAPLPLPAMCLLAARSRQHRSHHPAADGPSRRPVRLQLLLARAPAPAVIYLFKHRPQCLNPIGFFL